MRKILIIRFSSIGDIVLTTPVIRCIKQQLNAEVHFITKSSYVGILTQNPHIDQLYLIENEITEVLTELKKENYDHVVDLHNNIRSLRLRKALGRPSSAFPKLNLSKWLLTNFKLNRMPDIHVVDRYFEAVKSLNVKNDGAGLDYFIDPDNKVDLKQFDINEPYVSFVIGAKFATKRLPQEKIIEIIQKIEGTIVLLGGKEDEDAAKDIHLACPQVVNLVGKLNLDQSASVVQQSKKIITHDTGLMHIASAFKKPIISIWGNTIPDLGMYPYLPSESQKAVIHEVDLKCRPCSKIGYDKCPKGHFKCMKLQDAEKIAQSINQ